MNLPQVYTCFPSWTPLPPASLYHPSGYSQCTTPNHPVSCIEPGMAIHFYMIVYMFLCHFPQSSHPLPLPQSPKDCCIHQCLFCWLYSFFFFLVHNLFIFILFFNFTILFWFCHISKWINHRLTCVPHPELFSLPPPHTIPLGRPIAPAPSIQYRASNLDWRLVSYMILYIFQCHSPQSSHPLPLPQSPKDYSIHQCLFCCLGYRVYCYHLSKFHIYALVYCIGVFLSGLLHYV